MTSTSLPSEALLPIPILEQPVQPRPKVPNEPPIRALSDVSPEDIGENYAEIREHRARLLDLNGQVAETQAITYEYMMVGKKVLGYMVIGRSVTKIPGSIPIKGLSRDDVRWNNLARVKRNSSMTFWSLWLLSTIVAAICSKSCGRSEGCWLIYLRLSSDPLHRPREQYRAWLLALCGIFEAGRQIRRPGKRYCPSNSSGYRHCMYPLGASTCYPWYVFRILTVRRTYADWNIDGTVISRHEISKTARQYRTMKAMCFSFVRQPKLDMISATDIRIQQVLLAVRLVAASALIFAVHSFDDGVQITRFVGDGAVYSCKSCFPRKKAGC
jgi:hypothetical protein